MMSDFAPKKFSAEPVKLRHVVITGETQWVKAAHVLEAEIGKDAFSSWFHSVVFVAHTQLPTLYLANFFMRDYVDSHFGFKLHAAFAKTCKTFKRLEILVGDVKHANPQPYAKPESTEENLDVFRRPTPTSVEIEEVERIMREIVDQERKKFEETAMQRMKSIFAK